MFPSIEMQSDLRIGDLYSFFLSNACGFRAMPISVPGHADHPFRDDGDHDSGMMPITRSGLIPIS